MVELKTRAAIAKWTARFTPFLLISLAGYVTYVVVGVLSVNYLLTKKNDKVTAASILITYFLLMMLLIASFLRLTYTTYCDPPFVPLGKAHTQQQGSLGTEETYSDKEKYLSSGLELFYGKNVFVSDYTGRPYWCSPCANWKPDRAHHCSQSGRCIRKMDHFCPWVGGPVGESNFKFFIQFTTYGAVYCTYVLIVVATIMSSRQRKEGQKMETAFIITLGLASSFLLFSGGMTLHGIRLATGNMTQVERIGAKKRVYNLSVIVPPKENLTKENEILKSFDNQSFISYPIFQNSEQLMCPKSKPNSNASTLQKVTNLNDNHSKYLGNSTSDNGSQSSQPSAFNNSAGQQPLNAHLQNLSIAMPESDNGELNNKSQGNLHFLKNSIGVNAGQNGLTNPDSEDTLANSNHHQSFYRTFVILKTNEGENPWDLGSRLLNWKTVMGNSILDWILPIHRSPCCNHDSPESQFQFGPAIDNHLSILGLTKSGVIQNTETH